MLQSTPTASPTITPTTDPAELFLSSLPEVPPGFTWETRPELTLAMAVPDGWHYQESDTPNLGVYGAYITDEPINEEGRFYTGLSVFVFTDLVEEEDFATSFLLAEGELETTKNILDAGDIELGTHTIHHLLIEVEDPNETGENSNKIVEYFSVVANDSVYLWYLQSPADKWEEMYEEIGNLLVTHVVFVIDADIQN